MCQVAATLQDPQADPRPGGDVDAVQWKGVASLSAMQSTLFDFLVALLTAQSARHSYHCFTVFGCFGVRASLVKCPSGCHKISWYQGIRCCADLTKNSAKICMEAAKRFAKALIWMSPEVLNAVNKM